MKKLEKAVLSLPYAAKLKLCQSLIDSIKESEDEREMDAYVNGCIHTMNSTLGDDVRKHSRKREIVWGRAFLSFYLMGKGFSSVYVGSLFNLHHSTVLRYKQICAEALEMPQMYMQEVRMYNEFLSRV